MVFGCQNSILKNPEIPTRRRGWLGDEDSNLDSRSQRGTKARNKEQCKKDEDTEDTKKS